MASESPGWRRTRVERTLAVEVHPHARRCWRTVAGEDRSVVLEEAEGF